LVQRYYEYPIEQEHSQAELSFGWRSVQGQGYMSEALKPIIRLDLKLCLSTALCLSHGEKSSVRQGTQEKMGLYKKDYCQSESESWECLRMCSVVGNFNVTASSLTFHLVLRRNS